MSTTSRHQDGILTGPLRVPCHHNSHKSPPWTTNGGLRQFLSPPCMFFFSFFQKIFYTNVNFLIKWTMSSYAITNSSTLTSRPHQHVKMALAQHKKCPNNGSYRHLGLRYACYKCHVTTTATNHYNWRWMEAQDLSRALMYVFFLY